MLRALLLGGHSLIYRGAMRPLLFRRSAQEAHAQIVQWLRWADRRNWGVGVARFLHRLAYQSSPVEVGGVTLPVPLILAAGLVKGRGFAAEDEAMQAVEAGENIIPGWRSMPALVGLVEYGSYTRWPRLGNAGTVMWRDRPNRSTQNRVGLKNPGVQAAAAFLQLHRAELPPVFGINLAVSPGVVDPDRELQETMEGVQAFIERGVRPSWFTLNLSCPNTEDDPGANQTADKAERLCGALVEYLGQTPLWVKVSPDLAAEQYLALLSVFEAVGAKAVVATNTLPTPSPDDLVAGVGGRRLHQAAVDVVRLLMQEKQRQGYTVDVIACGGVEDGATFNDFEGVKAAQYWSSLVYRGPLVAAHIMQERKSYATQNC